MKSLVVLIISIAITFLSCNPNHQYNKKFRAIQSSNLELFKGVRIQPREIENGVFRIPYFTKELNGKLYLLPNYFYYGCSLNDIECLKYATNKEFNIYEFAEANDIRRKSDAIVYTGNYIKLIIAEYERIGIPEVLSDSKIGDCIIFYFNKEHYVAYVQDTNLIYNTYWKSEFTKKKQISKFWYSNVNIK